MPRILKERYKLRGAGVYAFFPFDSLDANGSGVFKIGMTTRLDERARGYHTYLPKGFYYKCLLINPSTKRNGMDFPTYYKMIEHEIFRDVKAHGGRPIMMDTRKHNDGETEWIYANEDLILAAFDRAYEKYEGKHTDLEYVELRPHLAKEIGPLRKNSIFRGEIIF